MLVMFILGLILIAMIAVAAQGLSGMYSVLNDLELAQQERQIEMLWESSISSRLTQAGPQGEFIAPLGSLLKDASGNVTGHGLPEGLAGPKLNSRGYAPLYCALGRESVESTGGSSEIILSPERSYAVQTVTIGSERYVTRSSAIPDMERGSTSIIAFIISPLEQTSNLSCADIRYNGVTGLHSVPGVRARVVPIYGANGGTLSSGEALNRSSNQFIDGSAYGTLNEALAPYLANPPARITLNLPERTGGYQLSDDVFFTGSPGSKQSHIVIEGSGSVVTGQHTLHIRNASLTLQNIRLDSNVVVDHARATFSGASVAGISASASDIDFIGTNIASGPMLIEASEVVQAGELSLGYGASTAGPLTLSTSRWRTAAGTLRLTSDGSLYGIWADQASQFVAKNSSLVFGSGYAQGIRVSPDSIFTSIESQIELSGSASTFMDIKGKANFQAGRASASGSVGAGAVLRDGGQLIMDNGQQWFYSGTPPTVGVSDEGGLAISGANAHVGGLSCWSGYLFSDSTAMQVANNTNNNLNGRVNASWSCNQ